jgi:citrate lyase synthetase
VINLELSRHDAIVLRHHLFLYTKDHPGFFSNEGILKIREISQQIDKLLESES